MRSIQNAVALTLSAVATMSGSAQQPAPPPINGGLPSVSSDGNHIAFFSNRSGSAEIWIIRADGTGERRVTSNGGQPQFTSDGRRILYPGRAPDGGYSRDTARIFVVGIDGSAPQPFAAVAGNGYNLSPDGKWLTGSSGSFPTLQLSVVAVDGSGRRELTSGAGMAFNGTWSPDGKRIAYARVDTTRDMQMWVVNADGTGARQLGRFSATEGRPQWPSWSPDGKTIAVQSGVYNPTNRALNSAHIWLIDVATGSATKLAAHDRPYLDETPSFFPDGRRIAFQSDRTGRMEVWVMNVDGSSARQLTH
jgi:TolB protein